MANGTEKPIEQVMPGDEVLSLDLETNEQVSTPVLFASKNTFATKFDTRLFDDGSFVITYGEHKFYTTDGSEPLRDINKLGTGSHCLNIDGDEVEYIDWHNTMKPEGANTYVLITANNMYYANGILVGENPYMKLRSFNERHLQCPDYLYSLLKEECDAYDGDDFARNPAYIKEVRGIRKQIRQCQHDIDAAKKELVKTDYLDNKHQEGDLSEER